MRLAKFFLKSEIGNIDFCNLEFIGRNNLRALIAILRRRERAITDDIGKYKDRQRLFASTKSESNIFSSLAENYERPIIQNVGFLEGGSEFEPLDEGSKRRDFGSTTFNICGWCKYACGSGRYGYVSSGSCKMLFKTGINSSVRFDTECILQKLKKSDRLGARDKIEDYISSLKNQREEIRSLISHLQSVSKVLVGYKPKVPSFRSERDYDKGEDLVVLSSLLKAEAYGDWISAVLLSFDETADHLVFKEFLPSKDSSGLSRFVINSPQILTLKEYNYLRDIAKNLECSDEDVLGGNIYIKEPDAFFLSWWLSAAFSKGEDRRSFLKALKLGDIFPENAKR